MRDRSGSATLTPTLSGERERESEVPAQRARSRRAAILAALTLVLAACGRKGNPERPPDADPLYPRRYPTQ
jgi:hypothetical protein